MSHFGNTPIELTAEVAKLEALIGDDSYSVITVDHRDKLEISLHLANWRGVGRVRLLLAGIKLLYLSLRT